MNSIFKLITNQQIPETANALVPVIGYEPWSLRALESIKSSIVNGVPTLIRVHSAADYPIENEELSHRLDMESHCVLIVGYNDDKEEFDIVDPWNPNWGGQHGGVGKLPYESLHSNKFRLAAIEALLFRIPFVPWSAAERNGHNNEAIFKCSYTKNRSVECVHIFASFVCRIWFIQHTSLYLAKDI